MWIPAWKLIPVHGMNGKTFILKLKFHDWYGYSTTEKKDVVKAVWDSTCEWFFEKDTMRVINSDDIISWWKEES